MKKRFYKKIRDKDRLDMNRFESKSYLATLEIFGYKESLRIIRNSDMNKPTEEQNPYSITLILFED